MNVQVSKHAHKRPEKTTNFQPWLVFRLRTSRKHKLDRVGKSLTRLEKNAPTSQFAKTWRIIFYFSLLVFSFIFFPFLSLTSFLFFSLLSLSSFLSFCLHEFLSSIFLINFFFAYSTQNLQFLTKIYKEQKINK